MKDIKEFSRNAFVYLFSNVLGAALPFLLLPFLVRELGPQEYGQIGLFAAAYTLMGTLIGMGVHAYVRSCVTRVSGEELRQVLGNAIFLLFLGACLMLLLLSAYGWIQSLPLAFGYIVIAIFAAFGQKIISIRLVLWQMNNMPTRYGMLSVGMTALNLGLSLLLVFALHLQAEGRLLGMWLPAFFVGPVLLVILIRSGDVQFSLSKAVQRKILAFGLPLIPHGIALSLVVFAERAALSSGADTKALGIYFAAFQLALPISILANSANLQFRSWSDRAMGSGEHARVVKVSYLLMFLLGLSALVYGWILQFVFEAIVGEQMAHGYTVCLILIGSACLRGYYLIVSKGLFFSGQTRPLMAISVFLCMGLCLCLFFVHDLYAVAALNLAFNFLLFLFVWVAAAKKYPQPWLAFATKSRPDFR